MATEARSNPDTILAYARVLRLTDRLLDVAAELREARQQIAEHVRPRGKRDSEGGGHAVPVNGSYRTPPQIAKQLIVKASKVNTWIRSGELVAVNCANQSAADHAGRCHLPRSMRFWPADRLGPRTALRLFDAVSGRRRL